MEITDKIKEIVSSLVEKTEELSLLNRKIQKMEQFYISERENIMSAREDGANLKEIIEQYHKHITESIVSCKSIEVLNLSSYEESLKKFNSYVVGHYPRDIVSGDFFWTFLSGKKIYLILGDCNGFGVTGSVNVQCTIAVLNKLINTNAFQGKQTSEILFSYFEMTNEYLDNKSLNLSYNNFCSKISLCVFDLEENTLEFSGVKQKLFFVRNNSISEIGEYKFASIQKNKIAEITDYKVVLEPKDCIYICTDGLSRQIGQEERIVFGRNRLKELLLQISNLPMEEQKKKVEFTFSDWLEKVCRTDDFLMVGIRY